MSTDPEKVAETADLKTLRLQPGLLLKAHPASAPGVEFELQFLGILDDKGVLVEPTSVQALKLGLRGDELLRVRGFTGRHDFSFTAKVMREFEFTFREPPLAYAMIAYPLDVEARLVRSAQRVRVDLPASVVPAGEDRRIAVTVRDLSTAGALLESDEPPGTAGGELVLYLQSTFDGEPIEVVLPALVTRLGRTGADTALTGVLFQDVLRGDRLALHYLVHRDDE
ncbi:MAG: PilZ domain-containing protein [Arenimonas sp.]